VAEAATSQVATWRVLGTCHSSMRVGSPAWMPVVSNARYCPSALNTALTTLRLRPTASVPTRGSAKRLKLVCIASCATAFCSNRDDSIASKAGSRGSASSFVSSSWDCAASCLALARTRSATALRHCQSAMTRKTTSTAMTLLVIAVVMRRALA
jgi:hypothetical protein